jgi:hypothetical protein
LALKAPFYTGDLSIAGKNSVYNFQGSLQKHAISVKTAGFPVFFPRNTSPSLYFSDY